MLFRSKRIEKIVKGLTNYSRRDAGKQNQLVNINKIIELALIILGNTIKESTNNFYKNLSKDLTEVKGNSQQLEQVIINLINNACQSIESKEKSVTIGTEEIENFVVVNIADEGIGINEKDLKYIMDPFFTTKRDMGGTGLGLSIAYNIIERHKGKLIIESKKEAGTTVKILLPKVNS